jgi:aminoglycoside phosphotransferase family enzyme/predicted kinase
VPDPCPSLEQKIDRLTDPSVYPHPVSMVTTIETHISIVFLTGDYAYKLKKPVDFGFLDFATLPRRQHFCEMELTLNRRTAPQLYLEVCPLYAAKDGLSFSAETDSPVCEYLVKMRQFDPNQVLSKQLSPQHPLSDAQTRQLSQTIAELHDQAEHCKASEPYGHPDDLIHPMLDNFPTLLQALDHPEDQYRLRQLADWTRYRQQTLWDTLMQRKLGGWIRACHGDLHLDNITVIEQTPVLFDGIEFNEQFRWIDPINDLAFLMTDLIFRRQWAMKNALLSDYLQHTGDYAGAVLLRFYQAYRALVRAKITLLRRMQLPDDQIDQRNQLTQKAQDYVRQAENDAYDVSPPQLILMQGVSGSGKSTLAREALAHFKSAPAVVISSDIERKRLFGIAPQTRVGVEQKPKLYGADMNRRTYERLHQLAEPLLAGGVNVIVDATNLKAAYRQSFQRLAQNHQAWYKVCCLQTDAPEDFNRLRQRLQARACHNQDPSDADETVMQQQLAQFESPDVDESPLIIPLAQVDTIRQSTAFPDWLQAEPTAI